MPQSDDRAGVKALRQDSVLAEYFPAGHVLFVMNVLTHPQMLQLQQMCLLHQMGEAHAPEINDMEKPDDSRFLNYAGEKDVPTRAGDVPPMKQNRFPDSV